MCLELLGGVNPRRINHRYAPARLSKVIATNTEPKWMYGITMPPREALADTYPERQAEVLDMFKEKGILYFEPLDIWHIPQLRDLFVKEVGREPKPARIPDWLIYINDLKNKVKKNYHARFG